MKIWERKALQNSREVYYYNSFQRSAAGEFAGRLETLIREEARRKKKQSIVFLCIGTDRSTGDSLGPLVGYKLRESRLSGALVFGTLDRPVHAMNLDHYLEVLRVCYRDALVVAVDASVGRGEHVGYVTLGRGALKPGLGVSKELRSVGDLFITGIVGSCGTYDPLMLQSVRLSVVMRMADCISRSICLVEKLCDSAATV